MTAEEKVDILRWYLQEISKLGRVCPEFETCYHAWCGDSGKACLLALQALKEME